MTTLKEYLTTLNTSEDQWGIYVNPNDLDDYRIGQFIFENGGISDDKVCIGSLEDLSFGFQNKNEILESLYESNEISFNGIILNRKNCNLDGLQNAYFNKNLAPQFQSELESQISKVASQWAEDQASLKIEELEEYFSKDGEYWQELKELELAYA